MAELIRNKILALKRTHEALAVNHWSGLDLRRLVLAMADAGSTWQNIEPRLQLIIPPMHVSLRQAPALAMVFHELFSHSREHGALSSPTGRVTLEVTFLEPHPKGTRVRLCWSEKGGSSVLGASPHPHKGLAMIEGLTRFELTGSADFHSSDQGFSCTLVIQLDPPEPDQESGQETLDFDMNLTTHTP